MCASTILEKSHITPFKTKLTGSAMQTMVYIQSLAHGYLESDFFFQYPAKSDDSQLHLINFFVHSVILKVYRPSLEVNMVTRPDQLHTHNTQYCHTVSCHHVITGNHNVKTLPVCVLSLLAIYLSN